MRRYRALLSSAPAVLTKAFVAPSVTFSRVVKEERLGSRICTNCFFPQLRSSHLSSTPVSIENRSMTVKTLLVDTDAGFDDILAISTLQSNTDTKIPFMTTVGGIHGNPYRASLFLKHLFPQISQVLPGDNHQKPTDPVPLWLEDFRNILDTMMSSAEIPETTVPQGNDENTKTTLAITEFLERRPSGENVDIMCLGPLTNFASWIESDVTRTLIEENVDSIWIMGGNIPTENVEPEFNFMVDPEATAKVLLCDSLREKIVILPAQTCEQFSPPAEDWKDIVEQGKKGNGIISEVLMAESSWDSLKYDPLCTFTYAQCRNEPMRNIDDKAPIRFETLNISVDSETGLLTETTDSDNETIKVKFIRDIPVMGDDGFMNWLREAIKSEQECT